MKAPAWSLSLSGCALVVLGAQAADGPKPSRPALEMSKAVVCKKVVGYEDFVELPDASLTSEDKLNVYFRPLNFRVDPVEKPKAGSRFRARFSEDAKIRRKGEKTPVQKKEKLVEYEPVFDQREQLLYIVNNISLKGLPPGEYELDVVLHDMLEKDSSATQTVSFTIVPTPKVDPAPPEKKEGEPESPPAPNRNSKKVRKVQRARP